jgi:hypothetical protein
MKIDDIAAAFNSQTASKPSAANAGSGSFAEMMATSVSGKDDKDDGVPQSDLEFIREKGFAAYAEEVEKRKMEEMREKILAKMGLSEEDLDKMPAEQRAAIEDLIAQEIQRRMQANAEAENSDKGTLAGSPELARDIADPGNTGSSGSVMLAVMEARDALSDGADARSNLPGDEEETS